MFILQEFFRRAGWDVRGGSVSSADELLELVQAGPCDLVGLSVSNDMNVEDLASVIRAIREVASPRMPPIIVGGRFFLTAIPNTWRAWEPMRRLRMGGGRS